MVESRGINQKAQSLVEMAIITPLLLIMFLGVLEVGWFLRNYMVAVTASREGARFAAKANNLNPEAVDPAQIGFTAIVSHTMLNLGDLPGAGVVVSVFVYPATWPCDPAQRQPPDGEDAWPNCHCLDAGWIPENISIGQHPDLWPHLTYSSSPGYRSGIDFTAYYEQRYERHLRTTCSLIKTSVAALPAEEVEVVVEVFYVHRQLLGFPIFTVFVPEEIKFRVPTAMRYAESRQFETPTPTEEPTGEPAGEP